LPGVGEAVAVARDDATGSPRIVAYVVARESPAPTAGRIRAALAAALPGYMIPSSFVFLDALPLAPSGKLDRSMLPSPGRYRPRLDSECRAPRTRTEARLARIWEEILEVRPVGIMDNFFELGGDSLAMVTLFAAVEEEFGHMLPPTDLLKAPTVEGLASLLEEAPVGAKEASLLALRTTGARPPLFCVDTRNAGIFAHLARHLGSGQPCYGLQPFGYDGKTLTLESLAEYYVSRVRAIQPEGPYYLCGLCSGGTAAYEMAQQLLAAGQRVAWLALFDSFIPRRSVLPVGLRRMIWRWKEHGERRDQRRAHGSRSTAPMNRRSLRLKRYVHENRKAMSRAVLLYRPKPYPGRFHLFLAEQSPFTEARGSRLAWRDLAPGGAETVTVPGIHHEMLYEPQVAVLASHVRRCLEAARLEGS
jgi:thioesterase domain-containing protein/acyl carrier protein